MFASHGIPVWFHWIGRPVLPVFLFLCAEAFWYTSGRFRYIGRLFIGYVFMFICNFLLSNYLYIENVELINNVFQTLLLAAFYMLCIEMLRTGINEKKVKKITFSVLLMLLPIINSILFIMLMNYLPYQLIGVWRFIPNLFLVEGGFSAVILGVLFYLFRKKRLVQVFIVAGFSVLSLILKLLQGTGLFGNDPQWLLIFTVIFIILYNGKRGRGNKYFFYIFYPAHIYLFYIIAWFLFKM